VAAHKASSSITFLNAAVMRRPQTNNCCLQGVMDIIP